MGNTQEKPSGSGGGGARPDQATAGSGMRSRGGGSMEKPRTQRAPEKGVANGTQRENSPAVGQEVQDIPAVDTSYLNAPAGALPPHLARLKNEGNHLFKHGQFGDALEKYTQAIDGCAEAGIDSPEDLCILYSNRAACYLKDGNSTDCIQDCTKALELQPYSLKPLLRRAMAYESLERYRKAYVDYKTVLQMDTGVQAAHDSVHRITKMLIEQDGPEWREKLPEIPVVPLSVQQQHRQKPISIELAQARAARAAQEEARRKEAQFTLLKQKGNDLVKKCHFQEALEKYSECLTIKPDECALYTNRAICHLKLNHFKEAKQDCDSALQLEPGNKKAFYRRALAYKGLQDYLSASGDLQEVLQLDPNIREAEQELEVVTSLLRQSLMDDTAHTPKV
ncbi:sperm-associated antigen 1A [Xiphias gladius]|uniref:sperm-associated antigen 1A n=1 Tax=Xiphias gladius TaxID=8245 RepID=UPI001A97D526|nr:sperm-associated antigen 1A [Xiphias gladius]XP_039978326.1 sperm-associated antigen 1A [Xiphias gladius]XP_039978327.1 sperm-associated antigen 1A [Xiphias gladius]